MEKYEINKYLKEFRNKLDSLKKVVDPENTKEKINTLTKKMADVNFWNDKKSSQRVVKELNRLKKLLDTYLSFEKEYTDIKEINDEMFLDFKEELSKQVLDYDNRISDFETFILLDGEYDSLNCIIDIHPGAGGTESHDWAMMVYQMLVKYAESCDYKVELLDYQAGDEAGIKSVSFMVKGEYAYSSMLSEKGVHRLVRISPFDSNSRRHTSFCSVEVTPELEEADSVEINSEDLKIDVYRSSGAGGQSVNTTDSAVRITHLPTGIVVSCQNERSQIANRKRAMEVLKMKLLEKQQQEQREALENIQGEKKGIDFGSQIRSYVLHPYNLVKDNRSKYEDTNTERVLNGGLKEFNRQFLRYRKENE